MEILDVRHIEKHFDSTQVLSGISFSLEEGQALSIIGSSGSGKTTLLRCLNFLERPDHGSIAVKGGVIFDASDPSTQSEKDIRQKRLHFGLVFQNFNLFHSIRPCRTSLWPGNCWPKSREGRAGNPSWRQGRTCWPRWVSVTGQTTIPTNSPAAAAAGSYCPGPGAASGYPLL